MNKLTIKTPGRRPRLITCNYFGTRYVAQFSADGDSRTYYATGQNDRVENIDASEFNVVLLGCLNNGHPVTFTY